MRGTERKGRFRKNSDLFHTLHGIWSLICYWQGFMLIAFIASDWPNHKQATLRRTDALENSVASQTKQVTSLALGCKLGLPNCHASSINRYYIFQPSSETTYSLQWSSVSLCVTQGRFSTSASFHQNGCPLFRREFGKLSLHLDAVMFITIIYNV